MGFFPELINVPFFSFSLFFFKVDSSKESAEAACDILSQLVNCSLKTLGLISTARPSFLDLPKVDLTCLIYMCNYCSDWYGTDII